MHHLRQAGARGKTGLIPFRFAPGEPFFREARVPGWNHAGGRTCSYTTTVPRLGMIPNPTPAGWQHIEHWTFDSV